MSPPLSFLSRSLHLWTQLVAVVASGAVIAPGDVEAVVAVDTDDDGDHHGCCHCYYRLDR